MGPSGNEQKSNVTDPDSAKMVSSRGILQGYNGLAVVDDHCQIVVHAEAHGSGYEGHLLAPLLEVTRATFGAMEPGNDVLQKAKLFTREDFSYDAETALCVCPAGHKLYQSGKHMLFNGYRVAHFKAPLSACRDCELRLQCLRHPERTAQRQLTIIKDREGPRSKGNRDDGPVDRMKLKLDTARGRELYSRRLGTVEPVFANLQNKGMRRFTLRRQMQSRRAVAALRHGAQHREDRRQGTGELSAEPLGR